MIAKAAKLIGDPCPPQRSPKDAEAPLVPSLSGAGTRNEIYVENGS